MALSQEPYAYWFLIFFPIAAIYFLLNNYRITNDSLYLKTWIASWIIYSIILCDWISYFGYAALAAFALCQGFFAFSFAYIYKKITKTSPLVFAFAFVAFEWILSHLPVIAFSWLNLSTVGLNIPILNKYARFGGGAALTFLIVFISALMIEHLPFLFSLGKRINYKKLVSTIAILIISMMISLMSFNTSDNKVSIAVVQGNDKNRYLTNEEIENEYLTNSHLDLASKIYDPVDFIVFPESGLDSSPKQDRALRVRLKLIAEKTNKLLIVNAIEETDKGNFNRNFLYSSEMELLGTYDKKRLVPFGEYVPAKKIIGFLPIFDQIGEGFISGTSNKTINGVATVICYESTFSRDVRRALGNNAKILVVTTNNRSYRNSGNSKQHVAQTRLRSLEFGISSVQSSISGPSALIDNKGNIVSKSQMFERTTLKGELPFGKANSFYAKTFDWLSYLAILVVGYQCLNQTSFIKRLSKWRNQIQRK